MSLVDYASSSDSEDDDVILEDNPQKPTHKQEIQERKNPNKPLDKSPTALPLQFPPPSLSRLSQRSNLEPETPLEKLPDASLLLNSSSAFPPSSSGTTTDHASLVAAAMASRKRDPVSGGGLGPTLPRSKIPKGTLPHSKNVPDTVGGLLVPPQLSGRSNVVTEDIGKLFVCRHAESPSS